MTGGVSIQTDTNASCGTNISIEYFTGQLRINPHFQPATIVSYGQNTRHQQVLHVMSGVTAWNWTNQHGEAHHEAACQRQ